MNNPPRLIDIAGITVEQRRGGSGTPLLVIHGELGVPGWLDSFAQLAEHHDVIVPSLPGFGRSTRPDWRVFTISPPGLRGSPGISIFARR